jgi:hypothetical protein
MDDPTHNTASIAPAKPARLMGYPRKEMALTVAESQGRPESGFGITDFREEGIASHLSNCIPSVQLGCLYVCAEAHNVFDQFLLYLPKGSCWIDFRQQMRAHRSQSQW